MLNEPNLVSQWVESMETALEKVVSGWGNKEAGSQILDYPEWSKQFAAIFTKWERRFHKD
jgi:hypothetical protein